MLNSSLHAALKRDANVLKLLFLSNFTGHLLPHNIYIYIYILYVLSILTLLFLCLVGGFDLTIVLIKSGHPIPQNESPS